MRWVFRILIALILLLAGVVALWMGVGSMSLEEIIRAKGGADAKVIVFDAWKVRALELPDEAARVNAKRYRATGVDASLFPIAKEEG